MKEDKTTKNLKYISWQMITNHWTHLTHPNTSSFPAVSAYNGSEQDTDNHDTIKTNLNVSALLLS